jgi:iron complex outermembrane receptor protein
LTTVRAGVTLWRLRAAFGVTNLFDRNYYEALSYQRDPFRNGARVYEPGRTFYANVSLALGEKR